MFWNGKSDKKSTLVFKTKSGIKRSRPKNLLRERKGSACIENQITEHLENEKHNNEGENIDG